MHFFETRKQLARSFEQKVATTLKLFVRFAKVKCVFVKLAPLFRRKSWPKNALYDGSPQSPSWSVRGHMVITTQYLTQYQLSGMLGVMPLTPPPAKTLKVVHDKDFCSTGEAATFLGVKETAIRNYLSEGLLTRYKFKTLTLLARTELKAWKTRSRQHRKNTTR